MAVSHTHCRSGLQTAIRRRAVAEVLRGERVLADLGAFRERDVADHRLLADVLERDPLVVVYEEHGALRGPDDLRDLMIAHMPIGVSSRLSSPEQRSRAWPVA